MFGFIASLSSVRHGGVVTFKCDDGATKISRCEGTSLWEPPEHECNIGTYGGSLCVRVTKCWAFMLYSNYRSLVSFQY